MARGRKRFYMEEKGHGAARYEVLCGPDLDDSGKSFSTLKDAKDWVKDNCFEGVAFMIYRTKTVCTGVR